jgi:hypothetical protein
MGENFFEAALLDSIEDECEQAEAENGMAASTRGCLLSTVTTARDDLTLTRIRLHIVVV